MHANNEIGTINDIVQIADIAEKYGAYMHTDAVQTVGHLPLDLQNIKVHFLSASAHKFHGPKGVGILYIRQGVHIKPLLDGGGQERNMRRHRVGHHHAASQADRPLGMYDAGDLAGAVEPVVDHIVTVNGEEGRQFVGAITHHGYTLRFQVFQCQWQIENRLGAGAHHRHRRVGQFLQVGRYVETKLPTTAIPRPAATRKAMGRHVTSGLTRNSMTDKPSTTAAASHLICWR